MESRGSWHQLWPSPQKRGRCAGERAPSCPTRLRALCVAPQDILGPFMEAGGLDRAKTKTDSAQRKAAAELKGGVFKKGAKAIGVKSVAERTGNLKIR